MSWQAWPGPETPGSGLMHEAREYALVGISGSLGIDLDQGSLGGEWTLGSEWRWLRAGHWPCMYVWQWGEASCRNGDCSPPTGARDYRRPGHDDPRPDPRRATPLLSTPSRCATFSVGAPHRSKRRRQLVKRRVQLLQFGIVLIEVKNRGKWPKKEIGQRSA